MESYSHIHQVVLQSPDSFSPSSRPTVSLVILAKPGDALVPRILDEVVPHVDEVVLVAVDLPRVLVDEWLSHKSLTGKPCNLVEVNVSRHPELYYRDEEDAYTINNPLNDEVFKGPYTNRQLITDWSKVRNLGWKRCTQEWRVTIDGSDLIVNPSYIVSVCDVMSQFGSEFGYSAYVRPTLGLTGEVVVSSLTGRIAKNGVDVRWVGEARENLEGGYRASIIEGSLVVVHSASHRSTESNLDQFKTLYADARRKDWQVSPCNLLYMAQLANLVDMPGFAESAIATYLETSLYTEERAWACALQGEIHESAGRYELASTWYERSLAEHPGYKSAYRLCRSRFMEKKWQACLDAFAIGLENDGFIHMVDDGDADKGRVFILVTAALLQLGRVEDAKTCKPTLLQLFPENSHVLKLCEALG